MKTLQKLSLITTAAALVAASAMTPAYANTAQANLGIPQSDEGGGRFQHYTTHSEQDFFRMLEDRIRMNPETPTQKLRREAQEMRSAMESSQGD